MELNEPLYFTEKIRPICLPRRDLPVKYNSQIGTIAGWGKLGTSSGDWAANLQETNVPIVRYKNSMSLLSNVCRYIAAGVLSKCVLKKMDCCIDPVVYTRVAALQDWIRLKAPGVRDSKGCPKQIEVGEY